MLLSSSRVAAEEPHALAPSITCLHSLHCQLHVIELRWQHQRTSGLSSESLTSPPITATEPRSCRCPGLDMTPLRCPLRESVKNAQLWDRATGAVVLHFGKVDEGDDGSYGGGDGAAAAAAAGDAFALAFSAPLAPLHAVAIAIAALDTAV